MPYCYWIRPPVNQSNKSIDGSINGRARFLYEHLLWPGRGGVFLALSLYRRSHIMGLQAVRTKGVAPGALPHAVAMSKHYGGIYYNNRGSMRMMVSCPSREDIST